MLKDEMQSKLARVFRAIYALLLGAIGLVFIVIFLTALIWPLALYVTEQHIGFLRLSAVVLVALILQLPTLAVLSAKKKGQPL